MREFLGGRANGAGSRWPSENLGAGARAHARVAEATSAWLLFAEGRPNSLIPVVQFNPYKKLDEPIMHAGGEGNAYKLWRELRMSIVTAMALRTS